MTRTIAEASALTGLTIDTLRYYEKDGLLLRPVPRSSAGQRRYEEQDVTWIRLLTRLRATGMPIAEIRNYADLVRRGDGTERERLEMMRSHRERVLAQLAEVSSHLQAIDDKIAIYTERLDLERTPAP